MNRQGLANAAHFRSCIPHKRWSWWVVGPVFCALGLCLQPLPLAAACTTAPAGLINWWAAENNGEDNVGTGSITLLNGTTFATGRVGNAFSFDGTNDIGLINAAPVSPPWSAEFWVKREAAPEVSVVLLSDTNAALKLEQYPNTKRVGITRWGVQDHSFNYIAPTGVWTHLVFVGTSNSTLLYTNGTLQGNLAVGISLPRTTMGRDITNRWNEALKGLVDEPSLYGRALTSNEVFALYAAGSAGKCPVLNCTGNDDFACRTLLTGTNVSLETPTAGATSEPGEPLHGGTTLTNSIWYTWTAPFRGSVVAEAYHNPSFSVPYVVAVYTGDTLNTLTPIAFNVSIAVDRGQVHFTAVENGTYQIALAGNGGWGLEMSLSAPPANDMFANANHINASFLEVTNGTFRGASREPNEPSHGTTFPETLWWSWTAPTNLGLAQIPVRLSADAVNHAPAIAIYTGGSMAALTPIPSQQLSDGMSRTAKFTATAGTTYRFALAGQQNDTNAVVPLVGNFRFRFNTRALGVDIKDVVSTLDTNSGEVLFTATACVTNRGVASSRALRVRVTAVPGKSMRGTSGSMTVNQPSEVLGDWHSGPLAPGQFVNLPVSGAAPAPPTPPIGASTVYGYGVHAELQEQTGTSNWMTLDEALIVFGDWPDLDGISGPGGGVVRLDPGFVGGSAFDPLLAVNIIGPPTAIEGQPTAYMGRADYVSGLQVSFTNTVWLSTLPTITNGLFTPGIVISNTAATVTAQYSDAGFLYNVSTNLTVLNLLPAQLFPVMATGGNFVLQIRGVSNRVHIVEATTNLRPPAVWQAVRTNNLGPTGVLNVTNAMGSNPHRYFRAREVP